MGLYGCRSGVACTKLPLFSRRSRAASAPSENIGDQSSTSAEPIGNTCANYSFCASIYVVKMLSKCEPRQSTSLTTPMPTIFSAPQSVWSRWCRACEPPHFDTEAAKGCQLFIAAPSPTFFTDYTLSRNGTLLGSGWQTPAGSIRRKGLSAQPGRAQSAWQIYFTNHTLTGDGVSRLETERQQASCPSGRLVAARLPTIFHRLHFDCATGRFVALDVRRRSCSAERAVRVGGSPIREILLRHVSPKPVFRELTPAGTSAHRRLLRSSGSTSRQLLRFVYFAG